MLITPSMHNITCLLYKYTLNLKNRVFVSRQEENEMQYNKYSFLETNVSKNNKKQMFLEI